MARIGRPSSAIAACIFVFLLLFLATLAEAEAAAAAAAAAAPVVEEKRSCLSQSHRFKGKCLSDTNCRSVCNTEGFPGGDCRGFRRRCFCTRPC